jgi:hypothetical protein
VLGVSGVQVRFEALREWLGAREGVLDGSAAALAAVLFHWSRALSPSPGLAPLRAAVSKFLDDHDGALDEEEADLGDVVLDALALETRIHGPTAHTWPIYGEDRVNWHLTDRGLMLSAEEALLRAAQRLLSVARFDQRLRRGVEEAAKDVIAAIQSPATRALEDPEPVMGGISVVLRDGFGSKEGSASSVTHAAVGLPISVMVLRGAVAAAGQKMSQKAAASIIAPILHDVGIYVPDAGGRVGASSSSIEVEVSKRKRALAWEMAKALRERGLPADDFEIDEQRLFETYRRIGEETPPSASASFLRAPWDETRD